LQVDEISGHIVDAAYRIHVGLGPGLLESVYLKVLSRDLERRGFTVRNEVSVSFAYDGLMFENMLRLDLLAQDQVIVELKSVERLERVHPKQLLTYLRLLSLPVGLLINFGAPTFNEGIHRVINGYKPSSVSPRLRVTQRS
jgi:GxxExxY protein